MQDDDGPSAATSSAPRVPAKITQKMLERAEYEKEVKEQNARGSEDDELEVFEDDEDDKMDVDMADRSTKGKGKEIPADTMPPSRNKRRRPAIDPFTGMIYLFYFIYQYLLNTHSLSRLKR
jgi:exosome complex protein LRP1